ncbi:hypothetical protein K443DRAFT_108749 [Laccaria amethystina LaAM-08-1]|uniref:Uncharacterized protein n=1 Tax=Laccaria amethystina LaAM-08-1 TaxID=1095629 RepID=A0A0C9WTU5_9AGAR|nr:hypothetical protein K443DRAFT_108749 [Laccaria amethystina LaAM-08-1]
MPPWRSQNWYEELWFVAGFMLSRASLTLSCTQRPKHTGDIPLEPYYGRA